VFERVFSILFFSLGLVVSQLGFASEFREGIHYQTLAKPVVTSGQEKIEVVELFWYGCPHCDSLDPALKVWVERLPADVNFVQIPVVFGRSWEMHARIFWVAKNIGLLETIHEPLFNAIHREGQHLQRVDDVLAFFERFGADQALVKRELDSFATESALRLADARTRAYGIRGVPAFVVNGRHVTGITQAGGESQLFDLLDELIKKSRQ